MTQQTENYSRGRNILKMGLAVSVLLLLGLVGRGIVKNNNDHLKREAAIEAVADSALAPAKQAYSLAESLFNAGGFDRAYNVASNASFNLTEKRWKYSIGSYVDPTLRGLDSLADLAWREYFTSKGF